MEHSSSVLLTLFIVYVAAQVGAEIAQRLRLPSVVGEIAAGCAIGPYALGWIEPAESLDVLAEIGVVLLLFTVGLETRLDDVKRVGRSALLVGLCGVLIPFLLGAAWAHGAGFDWAKSLFVAAAFVATSAGITASVLQELGVLQSEESRVILAAAVIDDVLAMLLLGIVGALQTGDALEPVHLAIVLGEAVAFIAVIALVGTRVMRRYARWLDAPVNPLSSLTVLLALCLGLAFAATRFGLAAIIGAFLAGMIASETPQRESLAQRTQPLLAFVTPFFFVVTGSRVDLGELGAPDALAALALMTVIALASKLAGGAAGAYALGWRSALIVGVGMMPRGEVGVVIASLGLAAGVFSARIHALIVAMSVLTSIVSPPLLALLFRARQARPSGKL